MKHRTSTGGLIKHRAAHEPGSAVVRTDGGNVARGGAPARPSGANDTLNAIVRRVLWGTVACCIVALPLIVTFGADSFRLPKELIFIGEGIFLAAVQLSGVIINPALRRDWPLSPSEWRAVAAASVIVVMATAWSTGVILSIQSMILFFCGVSVFLATTAAMRRRSVQTIFLLLAPAVVNAVIGTLQELKLWNPLVTPIMESYGEHIRSTALVGNPNDVGSYLVAPFLAAAALTMLKTRLRIAAAIATVVIGIGLLLNQTFTAIAAAAAGVALMLVFRSGKRAVPALLVGLTVIGGFAVMFAPVRVKVRSIQYAIRVGDYESALSNRVTPWLAAAGMFRDRPLIGLGPGTFAYHYFDYKLAVEAKHPRLRESTSRSVNFGEAHNEHLQILAETGILGYAAACAVLMLIGRRSSRSQRIDARQEWARLMAAPAVAALGVLMIAQFPLRLAVTVHTFATLFAICVSWSPASQHSGS